jgi:sugar-specific transcriptional regulator TrmB
MEQEIITLLREYGLKEGEIKVYIFLVENKELTAYNIAKETKIHRSTCYDILDRLLYKGFISKIEKKEKSYYSANDLSKVISSLKDKETILLSLIPKLQTLENKQESKIRVLDGIEGQKQFNYNLFSLAKNKKIDYCYIIGNTYSTSLTGNLFIERLIKETKKFRGIEYKGIWDFRFKNDKIVRLYNKLGKNKFLELPSKVGMIIFGDYVAFLYALDKPYAIEIKNKLISEEIKTYFLHLWKIAKD